MGWGGGVSIFDDFCIAAYNHIDPAERVGVLTKLVHILWNADCDTFDDSSFLEGRWRTLYPDVERALRNAGWYTD